jgi:hypothetical protein
MRSVRVVNFEPAHLAGLDPPVFERAQLQRFAAAYRPCGPAFTLMEMGMEAGTALGCGGLVIEGREGRAWAFLSERLRRRPILLHRTVKRALPALADHCDLESLCAEAHSDFAAARGWLLRLGFHFEEIVPRCAGTTESYARYRLWVH